MGITIDSKGALLIAVAWCGEQPDGLTVYRGGGENAVKVITLLAPKLEGSMAAVNIQQPEDGWRFANLPVKLEANTEYTAFAWDSEHKDYYQSTPLRLDMAKRLKENQILAPRYNEKAEKVEEAIFSPSSFTARMQEGCRTVRR
ncbi:hypothetical protein ACWDLG_41490 [Nonomuraea sp. NPDC003727]